MKQSLPKCAEIRQRRNLTAQHNAVARERRFVDVHTRRLQHRLELLTDGVKRSSDERRLAIVRFQ